MGTLNTLLGGASGKDPQERHFIDNTFGYDFQGMANFRLAHGKEPIDWARILSNQFRAESLTRELTSYEKFLYNSALDGLHKAQLEAKG